MDRVTKPQKKMLITLLRETKYMEGKKEKEWYWEKIQAALNTIGPKKTIIQWKKCWRDMRLTTRKKLAELKRCQLSGGSPPPGIELNQEDNDIIDIVGTEYFYEEMNGELKPENFMSSFDYVPEHFCDAILTAAAGQQQHMQHQKDQQAHGQQPHDHHTNDGETNDAPGSSNGASFQGQGVGQMGQGHNGAEHGSGSAGGQSHTAIPQHPAFHGGLHPHLLRRSHGNSALQRETPFEEKLLQFMQDAFPKKSKKRKQRDPDKLFLLSLYDEIKRVPEEIRLDVKSELIQILKKYQKKSPVKAEKSSTSTSSASKQSSSSAAHLPHSMYQLQKKYEKNEKEPSPQSQVERVSATAVPLHAPQQIPLFQLQKKYEESADKVHQQQNEQRKHVEAAHQQQHAAHQQPPPPPNEQHLHHPQMAHNIMFPLAQLRNEQPPSQQHHGHNPHQQQQQQQQHPHQQQAQQHHPPAIFGTAATTSAMSTDRPAMSYENVG
ncbi:putative cyclin-dependent serine/threonine-protein kinase DDB_G0272797/DDB_G0274007 isoform X2 [Scaptodrosophila lebanonensis]|uniref:Regulatory protein zeste n=1 Tax=Drosophila lebanonensis TaxID=7225 RepID=A0A6J2UMB2_DROLE|nr:putative cyclin-dependent serine/threonine-protein kinase DDB_G0272797/DDB_G0274007 isoform X2 [Scaptodrosophila lebanonensis]